MRFHRRFTVIVTVVLSGLAAGVLFWLLSKGRVSRIDSPSNLPVAPSVPPTGSGKPPNPEITAEFLRIEAQEKQAREIYWAPEALAQEAGRTFDELWDALNNSSNKWETAGRFDVGEILISGYPHPVRFRHDIIQHAPSGPHKAVSRSEWPTLLERFSADGWQLTTLEFRHNRFETQASGAPARSIFYFSAHLTNTTRPEQAAVSGDILVEWGEKSEDGLHSVRRIDATGLEIQTRPGQTPFRAILDETIEPEHGSLSIDPLIVHDLDHDGFSEIILGAKNLVYRRVGPDHYRPTQFCRVSPGAISTALIADFDGDGAVDFLGQKFEGLFLFTGSKDGKFENEPRLACSDTRGMNFPMAMTCGDVDLDGDLDVFIGQYKDPYEDGSVPTPFYDANDGNPAFLLLNDGRGNFTDATASSGLKDKRWRRSYSAAFVHLGWGQPLGTQKAPLGLAVASDFAGVDLYSNDGRGHFTDRTSQWVDDSHAFGMALCFSDFDRDGILDLFMTGMTSPAIERINHLNLSRPGIADDRAMRTRMTHGNQLYLGRIAGGASKNPMSASIARSGWSWGCAAPDVDNDGFADLFIVNGLESNASVRDYESEYWLHDRYVGTKTNDPAAQLYFQSKFTRTRGNKHSYGGYEKNRLFLNQSGQVFVDASHLFGVADERDSRNAVADDLDGDGRVDLIYTTLEIWPKKRQSLRILKNELPNPGHWIAFRLEGRSSMGSRITVRQGASESARTIVTGDSYGSQHSGTIHFGLGSNPRVDAVVIRWPDGKERTLVETGVDRIHSIQTVN